MKELLATIMMNFHGSFINDIKELIIEESIYFSLSNVKTEKDLQLKMIQFVSYYAKDDEDALTKLNESLNTRFDNDDMRLIYKKLGNGANRDLAVEFIENDYDMSLLRG